jgi:hypothetical protein
MVCVVASFSGSSSGDSTRLALLIASGWGWAVVMQEEAVFGAFSILGMLVTLLVQQGLCLSSVQRTQSVHRQLGPSLAAVHPTWLNNDIVILHGI